MLRNIQSLEELRKSGLKYGDRVHLGICGNHVSDGAIYAGEWERSLASVNIGACRTLGINEDATPDDIKKAFRGLAYKFHPDGSSPDRERFMTVRAAYESFASPEKVNLGVWVQIDGRMIGLFWGDIIEFWPVDPRALPARVG